MRFSVTRRAALAVVLMAAVALLTQPGCRKSETVEMDLSTPRSAALVFARAVESGDAETARSAAYAGGVELEWVDAMTAAMSGMRTLVNASEKRFGGEAHTLLATKDSLTMSAGIPTAEVKTEGNRATLVAAPGVQMPSMPMKQVDGKWKFDVGTFTRGEDITRVVKQFHVVGEITPKLAKDVEEGKFKTVKEVRLAIGREVAREVFGVRDVTTAATTLPFGGPSELPPDL
jgi:hypothetical protein